jgi:hypothetical protein
MNDQHASMSEVEELNIKSLRKATTEATLPKILHRNAS